MPSSVSHLRARCPGTFIPEAATSPARWSPTDFEWVSLVAERALLARHRPGGNYAVSTARWGGTERALAAVQAGTVPESVPGVRWTQVGHEPDFPAVVAGLDVLATEVCYRAVGGDATVFLSLWFGLPLASVRAHPGVGALVAVGSLSDARACRRGFRSLKGTLTDAALAGTIPWAAVPVALLASLSQTPSSELYAVGAGSAQHLYPNP